MHFYSLTPHYASDYSVLMALIDLIPVAFFFFSGVILLKDLYNKLGKVNYAMLSSGTIMVLVAGLFKAVWKIICSFGICDFAVFNLMFMPIQSVGFALFSIALLGLFKKKDGSVKMTSFMPFSLMFVFMALENESPLDMVYTSVPFLAIQTIGASFMLVLLMITAKKMKNTTSFILFIISFVTMWGMGGLAACQNSMSTTLWNWLEEIDNTVSQGTLFLAVYLLHKNGLSAEKIF